MATKRKTPAKKKTDKKTGPTRLPNGQLVGGNPGNSGGKKGRSGRPANKFREYCREIFEKNELLIKATRMACDEEEKAHDRLDAIKWIAEQGYGKAPAELKIDGELTCKHDLSKLTDKEIAVLERLLQKVYGAADAD